MNGTRRCIFLAGAPDAQALNWDEPTLLPDFDITFQRYLGTQDIAHAHDPAPAPSTGHAKWRSIPYDEPVTKTPGMRTRHNSAHTHTTLHKEGHLEDAEFLEHSIAVLEDLDISQLICTAAAEDGDEELEGKADVHPTDLSFATTTTSTNLTETSFQTTHSSPAGISPSPKKVQTAATTAKSLPGGITPLNRLPKAPDLIAVHPQTPTVNLLTGIISLAAPRTIHLRRRKAEMEIVELTVGDETRAGFRISFWLHPTTTNDSNGDGRLPEYDSNLRRTLQHLRPGNVVLLRNVALSAWKGVVYGQSLNARFRGSRTSVTVLGDDEESCDFSPSIVAKLKRVRGWVRDFVGEPGKRSSFEGGGVVLKRRREEELPPDTQD